MNIPALVLDKSLSLIAGCKGREILCFCKSFSTKKQGVCLTHCKSAGIILKQSSINNKMGQTLSKHAYLINIIRY